VTADRTAFAHDAVLAMDAEGDDRAPGGAITVALCGGWSHEPPCPFTPHYTAASRSGEDVTLRVLFAAAAGDEGRVRQSIDEALARGWGDGPDGVRTHWTVVRTRPSPVRPEERDHTARLIRS
jgi:hypothetical protein